LIPHADTQEWVLFCLMTFMMAGAWMGLEYLGVYCVTTCGGALDPFN
jgi:hypothetical protein